MKMLDRLICEKCNRKPSLSQIILLGFIARIKCKNCGTKKVISQTFSVSVTAFCFGIYTILNNRTDLDFILILLIATTPAFIMAILFGNLVNPIR